MKTVVLLPVAALFLAGCSMHVSSGASSYLYKERVHNLTPAANIALVSLANVSGPITVDTWEKPQIQIDALVHSGDSDGLKRISVDIQPQGDQLRVKTHYARRGLFDFNQSDEGSVDYALHMPASIALDIVNVSGNVSVHGIHNDVTVHGVSGDIDATAIAGGLDAATTSGAVHASLASLPSGQTVRLGTVSGSVDLTIPKNTPARIDAGSVSGDFSSNFHLPAGEKTVGSKVLGDINGGGEEIKLSTVSGDIRLTGK